MRADGAADLRPLGWARAAFGLVFLLRTTAILAPLGPTFLPRGSPPLLGWPDGAWHAPVLGLALPDVLVAALCILRTLAALALTLGIRSRIAGIVAGVAGYLVFAQDAFGYYHHLHMLYLGAILLGLTDSGASFALAPDRPRSPRSSLLLIRAFAASIYFWAAIGKLRPDWLDGRALRLFHDGGALGGRIADWLTGDPSRARVTAWAVVLTEIVLPLLLLWPRTRTGAFFAAIAVHVGFEVVGRVDSIGWQMVALLLVFAPTSFTRRSAPIPPARG